MMTRITDFRLALALLAVVACSGDRAPTQPDITPGDQSIISLPLPDTGSASATLITCPAASPVSTSAVIGPLGGILALGNTRVVIPLSAVLFPTKFTLTIPASNLAEIDVSAEGTSHYLFRLPIAMAIDYSRCNTPQLDSKSLSVWNIDPQSKQLLEQMIGVDEKLTHTVIFTTIHLSGYAVAD
jgi:hypothetical protein